MSSVSTISHEERLLPQCFSASESLLKGPVVAFFVSQKFYIGTGVRKVCQKFTAGIYMICMAIRAEFAFSQAPKTQKMYRREREV